MIFTPEHRAKLEQYLAGHELSEGLGNKENACSLAAINLAISGMLSDDIPHCMSEVLGHATIQLQDALPATMRNSDRFKKLLPDMAGTGRERDDERLAILMDWMWGTVLPELQPIADAHGFGSEWRKMCDERTTEAARAARATATAAAARADYAAAAAASAASAARADYAAAAAASAVFAAAAAASAASAARAAFAAAAADSAAAAARAASAAASAASAARAAFAAAAAAAAIPAAAEGFWPSVDPIGVLERMTYLGETK